MSRIQRFSGYISFGLGVVLCATSTMTPNNPWFTLFVGLFGLLLGAFNLSKGEETTININSKTLKLELEKEEK